jgi:hypothetical protein
VSARPRVRWGIRYGIPLVLFVAGWVILFAGDDRIRWDGWAMCLGSAGAVLLLNVLFRYGAKGDTEREAEEAAREYFDAHGHWPDEAPRR